jgi:YVTN family beta-propeller protein
VANWGSNSVDVIDTATNKVTAKVDVGSYPYRVTVSPDGTIVYVENTGDGTISKINTTTDKVTAKVTADFKDPSPSSVTHAEESNGQELVLFIFGILIVGYIINLVVSWLSRGPETIFDWIVIGVVSAIISGILVYNMTQK